MFAQARMANRPSLRHQRFKNPAEKHKYDFDIRQQITEQAAEHQYISYRKITLQSHKAAPKPNLCTAAH